jgi:hypothetical protein
MVAVGVAYARRGHLQFFAQLAGLWEAALDARLVMASHSPVVVLDLFLEACGIQDPLPGWDGKQFRAGPPCGGLALTSTFSGLGSRI